MYESVLISVSEGRFDRLFSLCFPEEISDLRELVLLGQVQRKFENTKRTPVKMELERPMISEGTLKMPDQL
jgi:septation ring formation regulator EzrA